MPVVVTAVRRSIRRAPAAATSSGPGGRAVGRPTRWPTPRKRTATVSICVKCRNYRGERKRHGRQTLIYAYWGYQPPSPESVFTTYRLRFGIESSYRQLHEGRIRTTMRRPEVRLLYAGIALVLRNLWVWLHYTILSRPRRGGRSSCWSGSGGRRCCSGCSMWSRKHSGSRTSPTLKEMCKMKLRRSQPSDCFWNY